MKAALTKSQFALVSAAILITVLLCFARRTPDKLNDVKSMMSGHAGNNQSSDHSSAATYLAASLDSLTAKERVRANALIDQQAVASSAEKAGALDKLVFVLDSLQKPAASAYYMQMKARQTNSKADWTKTAERYYAGASYFPSGRVLIDSAIHAFGKVLEIDPKDLNAKTGLGVCYVEGTSDPMKGVGLLKDVLAADSNYVDALLNLGNFGMTSGQYEKAISRFEKVLKLKPEYILLYVKIAEAYEKLGNKEKTIEYLEKYVSREDNVMLRTSIQNEINKLKKS
jgi:tetratricopeptide (TPR) repeat protein